MEGLKEAWCPLLVQTSGVGYCIEPHDCDHCDVMAYALNGYPVEEVHWLCLSCVDELLSHKVRIFLPGYYTEGLCQGPQCHRENLEVLNFPPRCSIVLQLALGRLP